MRSIEDIRNEILRYANYSWHVDNVNRQGMLTRLIIDGICNELYMLDNRLADIDLTLFEEMVKRLAPPSFTYVRPGHAVARLKPECAGIVLDKQLELLMKDIPYDLSRRGVESVAFTPVAGIKLFNARLSRMFFDSTLWRVDDAGGKRAIFRTGRRGKYNTVYLGLEIDRAVEDLEGLSFYINFPGLDEDHEYYEALDGSGWFFGSRPLNVKGGFPVDKGIRPSPVETDILDFYHGHYRCIAESIRTDELTLQRLPPELAGIVDDDTDLSMPPLYWISVAFPPLFERVELERLTIVLNTAPVLNRHYHELKLSTEDLPDILYLSSRIGEEYLEMNVVSDSYGNIYRQERITVNAGTYATMPIRKKQVNDPRLSNYLEEMIDVINDEKTAFPEIDSAIIMTVYDTITAVLNKKDYKTGRNWLDKYAEIARIAVQSHENTAELKLSYWSTLGEMLCDIPAKTELMVSKTAGVDKSGAVLLTPVRGARNFYDFESLKAVNRFYLVSSGGILTKENILGLCGIEAGIYAEKINVERNVRLSQHYRQGLLNVIEIGITPLEGHDEFIKKNGILKSLRLKLERYSPATYRYKMKLM